MNGKHYVGRQATSFQKYDKVGPVTGIALVVDENHEYLSGDQNGYVLEVPCSYGSQAMADALLLKAKGKTYQGYNATNATLDPLAELGDGITIGGMYGILATREVTYGGGHSSDISAPGEKIIRHRYSDGSTQAAAIKRRTERQLAETRASINKLSDRIELTVQKDGIIAAINLTSEQATIQASKISLEGLVTVNKTFQIDTQGYLTCTGGKIGGFTITGSSLYNGLSTLAGTANGVYIGTDGISLGGGKFKVDSFGNLTASSGTFTGKVRANQIQVGGDAGYISGSQIGSGTISGGNIGSGTISGGNIGYQTVGVGNMGTNSIENRCIQSGSIYNSTLSGGCVSNAKLDADLQNVIASAITASRITSGLASATSFSCTSFSFNGYPCYWSRCTSLTDGKYYITRNTY